jgi:hypothetical protein
MHRSGAPGWTRGPWSATDHSEHQLARTHRMVDPEGKVTSVDGVGVGVVHRPAGISLAGLYDVLCKQP